MTHAKKTLLLAMVAIAAVFAVPAGASAAEWTKEGKPLTEAETIELDGTMRIAPSPTTWFQCEVHATATLKPGSEGTMTTMTTPDLSACSGGGGYSQCHAYAEMPKSLRGTAPITATTSGTFTIPTNYFHMGWELDCASHWWWWNPNPLTATPDDPNAMSSISLSGALKYYWTTLTASVSGSEFQVTPAGVYGIK